VDAAFRTKAGPESTAVGGSSLGAVISLYAATKRPDVFGMVLAESLPLRTGDAAVWDGFVASVKKWPSRVYLGIGGAEMGADPKLADRNKAYLDAVKALDATLDKAGLGADRRLLIVDQGATHTEDAWAKRLPQALSFLFPPPMDGTK
jgi:predicted alpha/beta superfamily hydrolase